MPKIVRKKYTGGTNILGDIVFQSSKFIKMLRFCEKKKQNIGAEDSAHGFEESKAMARLIETIISTWDTIFGYCLHTETTKDVFDDNIYLEGMKILINNSIDSL